MFQEGKKSGKDTGIIDKALKDAFVRFLKDNHAWDEYLETLAFTSGYQFDHVWDFVQMKETLLGDGTVIFWKNGLSDVDWESLHKEWVEALYSLGYVIEEGVQ